LFLLDCLRSTVPVPREFATTYTSGMSVSTAARRNLTLTLHLTERYQLRAGRVLHVRFTIDDPQMFTHPWDFQADYVRRPGYEIPEQVCSDKQAATTGIPY
jgi:hypothetical protein